MASPFMQDIGMLSIHVGDLTRSVAFYRDTLGLTCNMAMPEAGFAEFQIGSNKLGLHVWEGGCQTNGGRPPATATGFIIAVPDASAAEAELRKRGVNVTQGATPDTWATWLSFADPDGNEWMAAQFAQH